MDEFFAVLINRESDSDVSDADDSGDVQDLWETDSSSSSDHERDDHDETSSSDGITDTECIGTMMMTMCRYTKERRYQDLGH